MLMLIVKILWFLLSEAQNFRVFNFTLHTCRNIMILLKNKKRFVRNRMYNFLKISNSVREVSKQIILTNLVW